MITTEMKEELIAFVQSLVQMKSISGQEEQAIRFIEARMKALGYDDVWMDGMGNLIGRMGDGKESLLLDGHVDVVTVNDEEQWNVQPFGGEIIDGRLYGRGAVDMKSGLAAAIYAGALAKQTGLIAGKTVYVTSTVFEEDCDGEAFKYLLHRLPSKPDYVVICEPSNNTIALGHKGKAQVSIKTYGVSAHGSAPEKGVNAIYEMAEIIQRVEQKNLELMKKDGLKGTLVMTQISSLAPSLNAVPAECEAYLDRRIVPGETEEMIRRELDALIEGKRATWEIGTLTRKSWTGMDILYQPFHPAWKIGLDHPLTRACIAAYQDTFGGEPGEFDYWDFSTNAVAPVSMGIATIGFGPGEYKLAHMPNENCAVEAILQACEFYARLIGKI